MERRKIHARPGNDQPNAYQAGKNACPYAWAHFFMENEDRKRGDENRRNPHNGGKIDKRHDLKRQHPEQSRAQEKARPQHLQEGPARDQQAGVAPSNENAYQNQVNEKSHEGDFRRGIGFEQDARD
jgi:hypothetical protein